MRYVLPNPQVQSGEGIGGRGGALICKRRRCADGLLY